MPRGKVQQFLLNAANITQTKHCTPTDGAAFCLYRTRSACRERHHEAATFDPQSVDRLLQTSRGGGLQPGAKCKCAFRCGAGCYDCRIADDFRLLQSRCPGHQYLRFGQYQGLEPISLGLQGNDLIFRSGFNAIGRPAGTKQNHACQQSQSYQRQDKRKQVDFLAAKDGHGATDGIDRARAKIPIGASR